jgi:hypothetical protein
LGLHASHLKKSRSMSSLDERITSQIFLRQSQKIVWGDLWNDDMKFFAIFVEFGFSGMVSPK